jgi:hypothetical protein
MRAAELKVVGLDWTEVLAAEPEKPRPPGGRAAGQYGAPGQ